MLLVRRVGYTEVAWRVLYALPSGGSQDGFWFVPRALARRYEAQAQIILTMGQNYIMVSRRSGLLELAKLRDTALGRNL